MIPAHLHDEFMAYMSAHDDDSLPDGAWFQMLEDGAAEFLRSHKLPGHPNDAVLHFFDSDDARMKAARTGGGVQP